MRKITFSTGHLFLVAFSPRRPRGLLVQSPLMRGYSLAVQNEKKRWRRLFSFLSYSINVVISEFCFPSSISLNLHRPTTADDHSELITIHSMSSFCSFRLNCNHYFFLVNQRNFRFFHKKTVSTECFEHYGSGIYFQKGEFHSGNYRLVIW